jgi:hypothetical protein
LLIGDFGSERVEKNVAYATMMNLKSSVCITGKAVKQLMSSPDGDLAADNHLNNRVRRQGNVNLGSGWSVGLGGVNWSSSSGSTTFNVKPTWSGFKPDGFKATLTFRF